MTIPKLVIYLSILVWIFPPLKQFRGRFFYYFLILALADPITIALRYFHIEFSLPLYVLVSAGLLISLPRNQIKFSYLVPVVVLPLILVCFLPSADLMILIGVIHLLILFVLFKYAINYIFINGKLQIFHLLLVAYETTMMLKFIKIIFELNTGKVDFYFITGFQVILGILFCFIREESPRLALKFR